MSVFEQTGHCCKASPDELIGRKANRPGLSEIHYRIADFVQFKQVMLDKLGDTSKLQRLTTRADDDPSIALIDGWATVLDVLSFYQERIANEGFLMTATERRSVLELARAIGYELNPGVAASSYLAFTLENVPSNEAFITLDKGLKVQSIPGKDELPQTFETIESIVGSEELNKILPRLSKPQKYGRSTTAIYLDGLNTDLNSGDLILLLGSRREKSPFSEQWEVRTVHEVEALADLNQTRVSWRVDLGHFSPSVKPDPDARVFKFTKKASLFGFNAPDWRGVPAVIRREYDDATPNSKEWPDFENQTVGDNRIDLDQLYPEVLVNDWVLLEKPNYRELYKTTDVFTDSRKDYSLTAKVTSIVLDSRNHLTYFPLRNTSVYTASRELKRAAEPLNTPVFGDQILLDKQYTGLEAGRKIIFKGEPINTVEVADQSHTFRSGDSESEVSGPSLYLSALEGSTRVKLKPEDKLTIEEVPVLLSSGKLRWTLSQSTGFIGTVDTNEGDLLFPDFIEQISNAFVQKPNLNEIPQVLTIKKVEEQDELTLLTFEEALEQVYHRKSVIIHGNVVNATHGESRSEAMAALLGPGKGESIGSGDNARAMQQFKLLQTPLTYVASTSESGSDSTLEISIDGLAWKEVASLYAQKSNARVFSIRHDNEGKTVIQFGDGENGARLPTGRDNIAATYRVGIGTNGNLRAGQLSLLTTRPLGVKEAINPLPAAGAQDPEKIEDARQNAPLTVLTMERLVSVQDAEDYAAAFAGIDKAQATVIWDGEQQLIHLTVAGIDGAELYKDLAPLSNLIPAIDRVRHNDQAILVDAYQARQFSLYAKILIESGRDESLVMLALRSHLLTTYNFKNRGFAEPVKSSELIAQIQSVVGVEAVVLQTLDGRNPADFPFIAASRARWNSSNERIFPAQLLTIDPEKITLEVLAS